MLAPVFHSIILSVISNVSFRFISFSAAIEIVDMKDKWEIWP